MTPAEIHAIFARRVKRERAERRWSVREMAAKSDVLSPSTICRAESGREVRLSAALAITDVLGLTIAEMFGEAECEHCDGKPPAGFSCPRCGRLGAT
jgi:transcriptional regulator with XRE-family HTH domain